MDGQPLDSELGSICDALVEAARARGVRVRFRYKVGGEFHLVRGQGGLLNLVRTKVGQKTELEEVEFEGEPDPELHLAILREEARREELTDEEVEDAKRMIHLLAYHLLEARKLAHLPPLESAWGQKWAYWLGQVLSALGHAPAGRRTLNMRALGWLEAATAKVVLEGDEGE